MSIPQKELFSDDHGRPFARVLGELESELVDADSVHELLKKLKEEAGRYGALRGNDVTPALRLLAFDGLITELLGNQSSSGYLRTDFFSELMEILNAQSAHKADN